MHRLAAAHAKMRLSKKVETTDLDVAVKFINLSLFGIKLEKDDQDDDDVQMRDEKPA